MKHDNRFETLSELKDYELENKDQDIRGLPLIGLDGKKFGTIKDLLVNDSHNQVVAIRLEDGRTCAVEPLEIHDNAVIYGAASQEYAESNPALVEEEVIPVIEETVKVGKRVSDHGKDILVSTRIVSDTVTQDVKLHDENVAVKTRSVNEALTSAQAEDAFNKGDVSITMSEHHEEAVVAKEAIKTDEVVVTKTGSDRVEHVSETVRKTEVDVDERSR